MQERLISNTSDSEDTADKADGEEQVAPSLGEPIVDDAPDALAAGELRDKKPLKLKRRLGPPPMPPSDAPVREDASAKGEDGESEERTTLPPEVEAPVEPGEKKASGAKPRLRLKHAPPAPEPAEAQSAPSVNALFQDFDPAAISPIDFETDEAESTPVEPALEEMSAGSAGAPVSAPAPALRRKPPATAQVKVAPGADEEPLRTPLTGLPVKKTASDATPGAADGTRPSRGDKIGLVIGAIVVLALVAGVLYLIAMAFNMVSAAAETDPAIRVTQPASVPQPTVDETAVDAQPLRPVATVEAPEEVVPEDPKVRRDVDALIISMVRGGDDPRIFIGSVAYAVGDLVDPGHGLRFLGVNEPTVELVFEDASGARYRRSY